MQTFRDRRQNAPPAEFLPPEPRERPQRTGIRLRPADVIDVSFETITDEPAPRRPAFSVGNDNLQPGGFSAATAQWRDADDRTGAGHAMRRAEGRLRRFSPWAFTALVGACFAVTFTLALTTAATSTAPVREIAMPLAIKKAGHVVEDRGGMQVLAVFGSIENTTAAPLAFPGIRIETMSAGRRVTLGVVPPDEGVISPGESRAFSARLPHAGGKVSELALSVQPPGVTAP